MNEIGLREKFDAFRELFSGKAESAIYTLFGGDIHLHFHLSLSPNIKKEGEKE